jgi:hypothetical protein
MHPYKDNSLLPAFVPTVPGAGSVVNLHPDNKVVFAGKIQELRWLRSTYGLSLKEAVDLTDRKDKAKADALKEKIRYLLQDFKLPTKLKSSVLADLANEAVQGF